MKNEMEINNHQKAEVNKKKLIQIFHLIYVGFIAFICSVVFLSN